MSTDDLQARRQWAGDNGLGYVYDNVKPAAKMGRLANGFQSDHGTVLHAVPLSVDHYGRGKALCGTEPGRRSIGWATDYEGCEITCKRCLAKLRQEAEHNER